MLEYELVDVHTVCQGIQKVRVGPATRSAVTTCMIREVIQKIFYAYVKERKKERKKKKEKRKKEKKKEREKESKKESKLASYIIM